MASARMFVALELPAGVRAALTAWAADAVGTDEAIRLVLDDALHVTLCFLGRTPLAATPEIVRACESAIGVLGGPGETRLSVSEALWLPPRRPRVLAVGLRDELGGVSRLQAALARELAEGGLYTPESRPYLAHVSVARVRSRRTPAAWRPGRAQLGEPPIEPFMPERVSLMRSELGPGGARYERLGGLSLGGVSAGGFSSGGVSPGGVPPGGVSPGGRLAR